MFANCVIQYVMSVRYNISYVVYNNIWCVCVCQYIFQLSSLMVPRGHGFNQWSGHTEGGENETYTAYF